jgi:hypothetical protein
MKPSLFSPKWFFLFFILFAEAANAAGPFPELPRNSQASYSIIKPSQTDRSLRDLAMSEVSKKIDQLLSDTSAEGTMVLSEYLRPIPEELLTRIFEKLVSSGKLELLADIPSIQEKYRRFWKENLIHHVHVSRSLSGDLDIPHLRSLRDQGVQNVFIDLRDEKRASFRISQTVSEILTNWPLRTFMIRGFIPTHELLGALETISTLRTVVIAARRLVESKLNFSRLLLNENLTTLSLRNFPPFNPRVLETLLNSPFLKVLELDHCRVHSWDLSRVFPREPILRALRLDDTFAPSLTNAQIINRHPGIMKLSLFERPELGQRAVVEADMLCVNGEDILIQ